jgi:hypothetical protein
MVGRRPLLRTKRAALDTVSTPCSGVAEFFESFPFTFILWIPLRRLVRTDNSQMVILAK